MSKKKSFLKKKAPTSDVSLQITSMADIFMILLVFLLKNYSTSLTNLAPTAQISLPEVTLLDKTAPKETLKLEIGPDAILVDSKPAVALRKFEFSKTEMDGVAHSPSLAKILADQRLMKPDPNTDSYLVVMADQKTPYATLKRVVASAAGAGFVDLQLVVVDPQ